MSFLSSGIPAIFESSVAKMGLRNKRRTELLNMAEENQKTYVGRPVVSHDGTDNQGVRAEVLVTSGLVSVEQKDEKKSRDTVKFSFMADNLKHMVSGWMNKETDPELYDMLNTAYDEEYPIWVRVERKRKNGIDRTASIHDLSDSMETARENIVNITASARLDENDEWLQSSESVTLPEEDSSTGSIKATAKDRVVEKKQSSPWNQVEAPPYISRNKDGEINPGSDAVGAVSNTYTFVYGYLTGSEDVTLSEDDTEARKQIMNITNRVLSVANKAQVIIYDGKLDRPDLAKRSHVRARSLVFHAMENTHKLEQEHLDDKDALNQWADDILDLTVKMWKWSILTVEKIEG